MGTWSIEPTRDGASIDANGKATFPANSSIEQYTITYDDGNGCKVNYIYNIPSGCNKTCCKLVCNDGDTTNCESDGVQFTIIKSPC